ncbi:MAG: hypothetical protein ABL903_14120 [Methylococcales bacterium]
MSHKTRLVKLESRLNPKLPPLVIFRHGDEPFTSEQQAQMDEAERKGRPVNAIRFHVIETREDINLLDAG